MADLSLDVVRDPSGQPNGSPKPPQAPAVSTAPAASEGGGVAPVAKPSEEQAAQANAASPKALFRVVRNDSGGRDIYKLTDDLETAHWGQATNGDDVDAVLNAAAVFDPATQSWDVPESVARSIADGRLSFPQEIAQNLAGGEAGVVRAYNALNFVHGTASREDVLARNHEATLKAQLGPGGRPEFAWNGLGKRVADALVNPVDSLVEAAKFSVGSAAGFLPMALEVGKGAVKGAATFGGGAAGAALLSGTIELPPVAAGVISMFTVVGPLAGASKTLIDLETGTLAADMLEQGFDDKTVRDYAVVGGAIKGALWMTGFKYLPAPGKEKVLGMLATNEVVQKAAASWLVKYGGEVAGVTALGTAQEKIRQVLNNMAAVAAGKPDLMISDEKGRDMLLNTAITMAAGSAVIGLPGAAREGMKARAESAADVKLAAETKARLTERAKTEPTRVIPEEAAKLAEAATKAVAESKPVESVKDGTKVVDTTGDYFGKPADEALNKALDKNAPPEKVVLSADEVLRELGASPEKDAKGTTYEQKIREAEAKAASRKLEEDLAAVQKSIRDQTQNRDRHERLGQSTTLLDKKLNVLMDKEQEIKNGITFYEAAKGQALVTPNEKLLMKPATVEGIAKLGFVEGRKEVLDVRRQKILNVAEKLDLTQADMRSLLKDKNYGTMSDAQFENWLSKGTERKNAEGVVEHGPSFVERAKDLKKRKVALEDLRTVQKDRALKHQDYARQVAELPPVSKMTTDQIHSYADILRKFDKGDELLTPKRVGELQKTEFAGLTTKNQVLKKMLDKMGFTAPEEIFKAVDIGEVDPFTPDSHLGRRLPFKGEDPVKQFVAGQLKTLTTRSERAAHTVLEEMHHLAAQAMKERRAKMGVVERVADWLVPQQQALKAYIEANKTQAYTGEITLPELTPSEKLYADRWIEFSRGSLDYLERYDKVTSRFKDSNYLPHVHRGFLEMTKDVLTAENASKEFKAAVKEFMERLENPAGQPIDEVARALGMSKAFDYSEFRTNALKPSANVFVAVEHYVRQFYNKVAADEARPLLNTAIKSFEMAAKDPQAEQMFKTIIAFTDQYLAAKTGDARWIVAKGGKAESALRFGMSLASIKYIAWNLPLFLTAPIGEGMGGFMALGNRGSAKAVFRMIEDRLRSEQGQRIAEKYKGVFVPEGPVEAFHPGSDVVDFTKATAFGALKLNRKFIMEGVLLGSMTEAEFKAGTISDARLAQIKTEAARWLDVHGNKSIRGLSVGGSSWTQFKGWAIPGLFSLAEDATALKDRIFKGKELKPEHTRDLYHLAEMAAVGAFFTAWTKDQEDKETFTGRVIHYARGEVLSMFQGPKMLAAMAAGGVAQAEAAKFLNSLVLIGSAVAGDEKAIFQKDSADHNAGDFKGWDAIKKQFTPSILKKPKEK